LQKEEKYEKETKKEDENIKTCSSGRKEKNNNKK
jgi:hypothetical protein